MRLSAEPWRWSDAILAADLTAGTKVAAFALLKFVNRKDGRAFASEETIAKACGMTERGVRAAIAALKAAGFVRVVRRDQEDGAAKRSGQQVYSAYNFIRTGYHLFSPKNPAAWPNTPYWRKDVK
jgi:hypothetical protein